MIQIAIIVNDESIASLKNLNDHLKGGWKVVHMCTMASNNGGKTCGAFASTCLVILEGNCSPEDLE